MDLKSELSKNVASCKLKLQLKKGVLQNKPVACYNSHYKPWCPFPVRTLGKGSLFKSRDKEGGERKNLTKHTFTAVTSQKVPEHPSTSWAPAEDFVHLLKLGAGLRHRKQGAPAGQRGCLGRADCCYSCMCVYCIIYHPLRQNFSHMKLQISSSLALISTNERLPLVVQALDTWQTLPRTPWQPIFLPCHSLPVPSQGSSSDNLGYGFADKKHWALLNDLC